jgi:hypothetical protein
MIRAFLFAIALYTMALDARAQTTDACLPLRELVNERLPQIGGKQWTGQQLKREGQVWIIIFSQKVSDTNSADRTWVVATRHSVERPDIYCIDGIGSRVDVLASLHNSNFEERFGLPGSNHPRCGRREDPLESVKVRSWASRELGESLILSLDDAKGSGGKYLLLFSKTGEYWILLQQKADEGTCYRDRGTGHNTREVQLK